MAGTVLMELRSRDAPRARGQEIATRCMSNIIRQFKRKARLIAGESRVFAPAPSAAKGMKALCERPLRLDATTIGSGFAASCNPLYFVKENIYFHEFPKP